MRQPSSKWNDYVLLRDEVFKNIPDTLDVFSIKKEFQTMIASRRKLERIKTIRQLVKELEKQLIIFPDKEGINQFYVILTMVHGSQQHAISSTLLMKVEELSKKLAPAHTQSLRSRHCSSSSMYYQDPSAQCRVPNNIRNILAIDLERCGGRDWEHFLLGLGNGMENKNKIRIKQGEVDFIERKMSGDIMQILDIALTKFEDRCIQNGMNIDILDHLIEVLKNEDIFLTPLLMTAEKIKKEKKIIENTL